MRAQLERKSLDIQKFEAHMSKMEALQFQLKEERDKYKAVIFDVIEDKQPGLYRDSRAKHEDRDGVKCKICIRHVHCCVNIFNLHIFCHFV